MKAIGRSMTFALCLIAVAVLSMCGGGSHPTTPPPPLSITPAALPNGSLGTPYNQPLQAVGGVAPFNWTAVGTLPPNLQLSFNGGNSATISGTPESAAQSVAFVVNVSDAANQTATASYIVSILGVPDTLSLSPASGLSFGPQVLGIASPPQTATLTNTGTTAVGLLGVSTSGDFSKSSTCGASLAAGANCSITVTYTPSVPGPGESTIVVNDDTVASPHVLGLTGTGLTSGPNATLSATNLFVASVPIGTTGGPVPLTVTNYGATGLSFAGITASSNFSETDNCSGGVASLASCTINVTFSATDAGAATGTLSIADNASGSPQTVSLSGTGTEGQGSGYCTTSGVPAALNGGCFHSRTLVHDCSVKSETASCPPGTPAIEPRTLEGGCVYVFSIHYIDAARRCP